MEWELLIGNTLFIIGLYNAAAYRRCTDVEQGQPYCNKYGIDTESQNVLWFVQYYSLKYFGQYLSKPICTCPKCMASVWGTAWYLAANGFDNLWMLPVYVLVLSGLVGIVSKFTNNV